MCECCSGSKRGSKYKKFEFLNDLDHSHEHEHDHDHKHEHDHEHKHHHHHSEDSKKVSAHTHGEE